MDKIQQHEDQHGMPWLEFVKAVVKRGEVPAPSAMPSPSLTATLSAFINDGRWIAECPTGDGNAFVVSRNSDLFWCGICGNRTTAGSWIRVRFPPGKAAIERLLMHRPDERNRNWLPGETVANLARENRAHGLRDR